MITALPVFFRKQCVILLSVACVACALFLAIACSVHVETILLDPNIQYQTITGWEATSYVSKSNIRNNKYTPNPAYPHFIDPLLGMNVELGINRVRLEIRSGVENAQHNWYNEFKNGQIFYRDTPGNDWREIRYDIVNDNADPNTVNFKNFHFDDFDEKITNIILPFKQKLEAQGKQLHINLCYVDFGGSLNGFEHKNNPEEYAEFLYATVKHMDDTFGIVPDIIDHLEPNNSNWNSDQLADGIVAANARLTAAGYNPKFVAPSHAFLPAGIEFLNRMIQRKPELSSILSEFSYHLYSSGSTRHSDAVRATAAQYGLQTSMLEWWFGDWQSSWNALHDDLKVADVSAWQLVTFWDHANVDTTVITNPVITLGDKSKYSKQYFTFIDRGARRISATTPSCADHVDCTGASPIAFMNPDGSYVVVIRTNNALSIVIENLPSGTYGVVTSKGIAGTDTDPSREWGINQPDIPVAQGQSLQIPNYNLGTNGLITVYGKSAAAPSPKS